MKNLFILSVLVSTSAFATPQLYSSCSNQKKITAPKGSAGHLMGKDCRTVYVLPPRKGAISLAAVAQSMSPAQCRIINGQMKSFNQQAAMIQDMINYNKLSEGDLRKLKQESEAIRRRTTERRKGLATLNTFLLGQDAKIDSQKQKVDLVNNQLTDCLTGCDRLERQLKREKDVLIKLENDKLNISQKKNELNALLEVDDKRLAEIRRDVEAGSIIDQDLLDRQAKLLTDYQSFIDEHDKGEGAAGQIIFENTHQDMVEAYREENDNSEFSFVQIPVITTLVFGVRSETPGVQINSSVRSYGIPGLKADLGSLVSADVEGTPFGATLSGKMILSSITGCALFDDNNTRSYEDMANRMAAHMSANAFFKYQVQTSRGYYARFDLQELYRKIHKKTSKGGFFSTKSINEISEETKSDNSVEVKLNSNHTSNQFENTDQMITSIRQEIVAQAISNLARVEGKETQVQLDLSAAPKSGAEATSEALRKCPHLYCQVGAVVFDIGHALFGSKEQRASYLKTVSSKVEYTVEDNKMVEYYGSYTFDLNASR